MKKDLSQLMDSLEYCFKNKELLERALSHRSVGKNHNELLEFLGDSILNFVIASELFKRFPQAKEGQLSRLRSDLVKEEALMTLAQKFELSEMLFLGVGELKSGGAFRPSILADTMEAIIGAIYCDSDSQTCYQVIVTWYQETLQNLSLSDVKKDPKSLLQEVLQAEQLGLPEYRLASVSGEEHEQHFVIECVTARLNHPIKGEGSSRRKAEQDAAAKVLKEMGYDQ